MDLRHARTFVTVAELGSVSKAALRLRIAQPALSRQISDLENELGFKLSTGPDAGLYWQARANSCSETTGDC
ncbi:MAG: LysR family transcriptional regulator [Microvirga sp.]